MNDALIQQLLDRIADLEGRIAAMESQQNADPFPKVFPADVQSDGTWTEQMVDGSDLADWPDGRKCDSAAAPSKVIDPGSKSILLEVDDGSGDRRYMKVGGALPPGGLKGQVLSIIDDDGNVDWEYPILT